MCRACPGVGRCRAILEIMEGQMAVECWSCASGHHEGPEPKTRTSVFTSSGGTFTRTQVQYAFVKRGGSSSSGANDPKPDTSWRSRSKGPQDGMNIQLAVQKTLASQTLWQMIISMEIGLCHTLSLTMDCATCLRRDQFDYDQEAQSERV